LTELPPCKASAESLEAWALATLPRAVAYAGSLLRDPTSADDVVHDCYCRILRKADVYDIPRDGTKILYRAITNACINLARARRFVSLDGLDGGAFVDRRSIDPADALAGQELADGVAAALARLTLPQRAALELKSLGHSLHEIAEALETTPNNAGVLVHRARQAVANFLAGQEEKPA
jgi:RNA polymerase sigma-70 factor, ECF subfamily